MREEFPGRGVGIIRDLRDKPAEPELKRPPVLRYPEFDRGVEGVCSLNCRVRIVDRDLCRPGEPRERILHPAVEEFRDLLPGPRVEQSPRDRDGRRDRLGRLQAVELRERELWREPDLRPGGGRIE